MDMTQLALARGRSYISIYRAALLADIPLRGSGRVTDLTPADVRKIDDELDRRSRPAPRRADPAALFEAHRAEWLDCYAEAISEALDPEAAQALLTIYGAIAYLRTAREWLEVKLDGQKVGAILLALCRGCDVDWNPDGTWSGFAGWLEKNGFEAREGE